jgi:hypothetical protein
MEQSPSWNDSSYSDGKEITRLLWTLRRVSVLTQQPVTLPFKAQMNPIKALKISSFNIYFNTLPFMKNSPK